MSKPADSSVHEGEIVVMEGILTELQVSPGKENLFKQIDAYYSGKSLITGLGAVVGDLYGQAAAAASVAMYEGEYTENFLCLIKDRVVCGTFGGASKLPVGKHVKLVARKHDDLLVAQGILCESEGLVWLGHAWGYKAEMTANLKIGLWCFLFQLACMAIATGLMAGFGSPTFWTVMKLSIFGGAAICFGTAFWSNSTMTSLANPATEVLRLLGFCDPEKINLNSYRYGIVHSHALIHTNETQANHFNIHCYKKAIDDGIIRMT